MIKKAKLLEAALSRYRAQRDEALAVLHVYLTDAVGIGEHSSLVDEITKWTQVLTEAEDNIETLTRHYLTPKKKL
jgi:hypothetical protein